MNGRTDERGTGKDLEVCLIKVPLTWHLPRGLREIKKRPNRINKRPEWDSNMTSSEYEYRVLPLHKPVL
jgi:hypothetical protein